MERKKIIDMKGIVKKYFIGTPNELAALGGVDITVYEGEFVAIVGASGSGKSTLMNIIGSLDRPTEGTYFLDGIEVTAGKDDELSKIRNRKVGFVFQTYNLIAKTNAIKNVEMPMLYAGIGARKRAERAAELLDIVGMKERMKHLPEELSGGQKQRVAIARAMVTKPKIILADEPTGALDSATGKAVLDLFRKINEQGTTIVIVTHDVGIGESARRCIRILDGKIASDKPTGVSK